MRLSARILDPASTINNLKYLNEAHITPGSTYNLLFQLVDLDTVQPANMLGNRYVPILGAVLEVELFSNFTGNFLSPNQDLIFSPTQPFALDGSIWSIPLSVEKTLHMAGTNMKLTLTEGANVTVGRAQQVISISGADFQS
jgi:hypothetical protein